jgi:spermidine/putrescine transport system permease protein
MGKATKSFRFDFLTLYSILLFIFLFSPIVIIILFSFNPSRAGSFPMAGFSIKWYLEVIKSSTFISAVKNSIYVAIATSFFSVLIGTLASFGLTRYNFRFKNVIKLLVLLPITIPPLLIGISLLSYFNIIKIPLSLLTVTFSHLVFCIPFVILVMNSRLEGFDFSVEEAAKDLGANRLQTFRYVTFPIMRSSIIGVGMLAFALSFDEFLITFFTIGADNTLPLVIWAMLRRGISPAVNAISTLVLIVTLLLILAANKLARLKL